MRYMIITDDSIVYYAESNISAFITGALLQLGVRGKQLKELGDIIEDIYTKVQHVDLGDIVDYVYYNDDKVGTFTRSEWVEKILEGQ
jgi:hypothetical protein